MSTQHTPLYQELLDRGNAMLAENARLREAVESINALTGNVDHGTQSGPNDAKMRGDLLNDIRSIARAVLAKAKGKA